MSMFQGSPIYAAPEIMLHHDYGKPGDIWSLGCIFYEICELRSPFAYIDVSKNTYLYNQNSMQLYLFYRLLVIRRLASMCY